MKYCLDQGQDPQGKHIRNNDLCDDTKLAMQLVITILHRWLLNCFFLKQF